MACLKGSRGGLEGFYGRYIFQRNPSLYWRAMNTSVENVKVRTVQDWIERASSQTSKKNYGQTLNYWTEANGFSSPEDGIESIRNGAVDPYESADTGWSSI